MYLRISTDFLGLYHIYQIFKVLKLKDSYNINIPHDRTKMYKIAVPTYRYEYTFSARIFYRFVSALLSV